MGLEYRARSETVSSATSEMQTAEPPDAAAAVPHKLSQLRVWPPPGSDYEILLEVTNSQSAFSKSQKHVKTCKETKQFYSHFKVPHQIPCLPASTVAAPRPQGQDHFGALCQPRAADGQRRQRGDHAAVLRHAGHRRPQQQGHQVRFGHRVFNKVVTGP